MGLFLDSRTPYEAYRLTAAGKYFVDKTDLLAELIPALGSPERFFCITRPRRFGKSVMANMIGTFFGKTAEAGEIFGKLKISSQKTTQELEAAGCKSCREYLNRYHVIYIDFSVEPRDCCSYRQYIDRVQSGLNADLAKAYPEYGIDENCASWDLLTDIFQKTGDKFIFVIDEWDAVFHLPYITEAEKQGYLRFLRSLLKGQVYVELAYMTGILPIAKHSDGSELNMFLEYNMATSERFSEYFGFLDSEVDTLYEIYQRTAKNVKISREDLAGWYDGYHTAAGDRVYNPRSVVCALTDNQLRNYWTSSGTYDSIFGYIRDHTADVQDDLALLFSGERIPADIQEYAASSMCLSTKDEIYSAMVVYGLLTYEDGCVFIPNRELRESYAAMMKKEKSLGYIHNLASVSKKMLSATLAGDVKMMADIFEFVHDTETPILSYSNETELSAVVNLIYLAARDQYRVEREDKAGKGYVDFIFYPERRSADALILELKVDSTPDEAIRQIKDKKYALRFQGKLGEKPKYTGRILAVGISYEKKTKKHACKVEELEIGNMMFGMK